MNLNAVMSRNALTNWQQRPQIDQGQNELQTGLSLHDIRPPGLAPNLLDDAPTGI